MRRTLAAGIIGGALVTLMGGVIPASAALHEQIVFSGEAHGTFSGTQTDVGFWIWCAVDQAGGYDDCNGAMHFDQLMPSKHVDGSVTELGTGESQHYRMDVTSRDGTIVCSLENTPPITSGRTNRIDISCSAPSGSASTSTAVISSNG